MPTARRVAILVTVAIATASAGASGQDAHYWSQQYGTRSTLLGGAVIGSVNDLSATYYNPAALALSDDPAFLLSAQAYQFRNLTLENGAGTNTDLSSSTLRPAADIIAGPRIWTCFWRAQIRNWSWFSDRTLPVSVSPKTSIS